MVSRSQLQSTTDVLFVRGVAKTAVTSSVLASAMDILVEEVGPISVQTSRFLGANVFINSAGNTTSAVLSNFIGVTGTVTITGATGCTSSKNVPDTPCS
jgi:hypothetical protein